MSLLFTGGGSREAVIAWRISQDHPELDMFFAPGNAQTAEMGRNLPLAVPGTDAPQEIWDRYFWDLFVLIKECEIDAVFVFPEDALAHGVADYLRARGIKVFGPSRAAAQIESSKIFAKELMRDLGITTSPWVVLGTEDEARDHFSQDWDYPVVVKDDSLAAGKGVCVAKDSQEALEFALSILAKGHLVLVEEFISGREVSGFVFTDGEHVAYFGEAADYKPIRPGGPNTGGVGAYSTVPWLTTDQKDEIGRIARVVIAEMDKRGTPFTGQLFLGIIIDSQGNVWVMEFNARPGDPESQVLYPRFEGDLLEVLLSCTDGTLGQVRFRLSEDYCVGVVVCSGGYPGAYQVGFPISGLDPMPEGVIVFQAGTVKNSDGRVVTNGGRVLTVAGRGATMKRARANAYSGVVRINFEGGYYRSDIALL